MLVEEGLWGKICSDHRFVVYGRSGTVELVDSPFSMPRLALIEISAEAADELAIRIDYDRLGEPQVSGRITITARTPRAAEIAEQLRRRIGR